MEAEFLDGLGEVCKSLPQTDTSGHNIPMRKNVEIGWNDLVDLVVSAKPRKEKSSKTKSNPQGVSNSDK